MVITAYDIVFLATGSFYFWRHWQQGRIKMCVFQSWLHIEGLICMVSLEQVPNVEQCLVYFKVHSSLNISLCALQKCSHSTFPIGFVVFSWGQKIRQKSRKYFSQHCVLIFRRKSLDLEPTIILETWLPNAYKL